MAFTVHSTLLVDWRRIFLLLRWRSGSVGRGQRLAPRGEFARAVYIYNIYEVYNINIRLLARPREKMGEMRLDVKVAPSFWRQIAWNLELYRPRSGTAVLKGLTLGGLVDYPLFGHYSTPMLLRIYCVSLTRVTKSYLLALGTGSYFTKH